MMRIAVVLPAPFGSEEAGDEPGLDLERDVVDGREGAVALGESFHCDHGVHPGRRRLATSVMSLISTPTWV